jgi:hypothetical protein
MSEKNSRKDEKNYLMAEFGLVLLMQSMASEEAALDELKYICKHIITSCVSKISITYLLMMSNQPASYLAQWSKS